VTISRAVAQHISQLRSGVKPLTVARTTSEESKSFGVYLGSFAYPATPAQARLLSQWDVVVLDPLASGVKDALSSAAYVSPQVVGRLDIRSLTQSERASNDEQIIRSIRKLQETIATSFTGSDNTGSPFTAILLANFVDHFTPAILNELVGYINSLGLSVMLEISLSGPGYLTDSQCRNINMKAINGVIYKNGTIRPDGDQQNFHQMDPMRVAMRAIAAQRVAPAIPMMLWETIDDGVEHQYAITQRCFNWCRFNSALCWVGSASALVDAETAQYYTVSEKPLGALMWMKNARNMNSHNVWRENDKICPEVPDNRAFYDSLDKFIPDLASWTS
jgi:hypothetical protein